MATIKVFMDNEDLKDAVNDWVMKRHPTKYAGHVKLEATEKSDGGYTFSAEVVLAESKISDSGFRD